MLSHSRTPAKEDTDIVCISYAQFVNAFGNKLPVTPVLRELTTPCGTGEGSLMSSDLLPSSSSERKEEKKEVSTCSTSILLVPPPVGMRELLRKSGMSKEWPFRLGTVLQLATASTGAINATVNASTGTLVSEFAQLLYLFDEFFITSFEMRYIPYNQFIAGSAESLSTPSRGSLVLAQLHHGSPTYGSTSAMLANITCKIVSSSEPWRYEWVNVEKRSSTVSTSSTTSTPLPTQSWCLTNSTAAALYTGLVQVRNASNFTGALSSNVGDIYVFFNMRFRARA